MIYRRKVTLRNAIHFKMPKKRDRSALTSKFKNAHKMCHNFLHLNAIFHVFFFFFFDAMLNCKNTCSNVYLSVLCQTYVTKMNLKALNRFENSRTFYSYKIEF